MKKSDHITVVVELDHTCTVESVVRLSNLVMD